MCLAVIIVLLVVVVAAVLGLLGPGAKEGFRWGPRGYRDSRYRWIRAPTRRRSPPMWWWSGRYARQGYAAPLELTLPLQNYYDYLYGYPPSARMPYNA